MCATMATVVPIMYTKTGYGYTLERSSEKRLTDVPITKDEEKKNRHERCLGVCSNARSSTVGCVHITRAHTMRVVRTYYIYHCIICDVLQVREVSFLCVERDSRAGVLCVRRIYAIYIVIICV